jgi:hypothetical protein
METNPVFGPDFGVYIDARQKIKDSGSMYKKEQLENLRVTNGLWELTIASYPKQQLIVQYYIDDEGFFSSVRYLCNGDLYTYSVKGDSAWGCLIDTIQQIQRIRA